MLICPLRYECCLASNDFANLASVDIRVFITLIHDGSRPIGWFKGREVFMLMFPELVYRSKKKSDCSLSLPNIVERRQRQRFVENIGSLFFSFLEARYA